MSETTPTPWHLDNPIELRPNGISIYAWQGPIKVSPATASGVADAALIVTAVNAHEPMKKALDDLLNQVIHWGDDSQLEAIAAEIKAAEAALRLAEGEKEASDT